MHTRSGSTQDAGNVAAPHFRQLDGLRGLAILLVVIYHFGLLHANYSHSATNPFAQLAQLGWIGVDLFFVLSGYLITGILLESRERAHYLRNFLARRFLRIWPLYYLNLVLLFFLAPAVLSAQPAELVSMQREQGWFWLYAANWLFAKQGGFEQTSGGYFWSLAVEEQFYLVWPIVVYYLTIVGLRRLCIGLFVVSVAARFLLVAGGVSTNTAYTMTFSHMDGLVLGAYLATALRTPEVSTQVDRWLPRLAIAGLGGLVCVRLIDGGLVFWGPAMVTAGIACGVLVFGYVLWALMRRTAGSLASRFFTNVVMVETGRYSYALYLAHVPVGFAVHSLMERRGYSVDNGFGYWAFFVIALLASWGLAAASWHVFEKHVLRLKRYFA